MSWTKTLLQDLHDKLSPSEFEKLIYALLDRMGFSDLELTGKSGDGGIDLIATWSPQLPGLEIDLNFVIQVKRTSPKRSLNPLILRALKGSMTSGQWGLLVTTGKVSSKTREEGLNDPSRIVSAIDGLQLVDLLATHEVGVKREYNFDASFLKPKVDFEEPPEPAPSRTYPRDLTETLTNTIGETFERVGRTTIYKSDSKVVIARWSQRYDRKGMDYWYGLKSRDLTSIKSHGITHFAYVCSNVGVVLLPTKIISKHVETGTLGRSPKEGPLYHYHIQFEDDRDELKWVLRNGVRESIEKFFCRIKE